MFICALFTSHTEWMCQHINYYDTTNLSGYLPQVELLWSHDIHTVNYQHVYHVTKILQNFRLTLVISEIFFLGIKDQRIVFNQKNKINSSMYWPKLPQGQFLSRVSLNSYFFFLLCVYPTPPPWAGCNTRSIFKWNKAGLNLEFSFLLTDCLAKAKEPSLSYYLSLVVEKRDRFMSFLRALAWREKQTASLKIWTLHTKFISYNDNNHATHAFDILYCQK